MSWRVFHVRPRSEKQFARICELARRCYYLPLREEVKVYQRRRVTVHKPLFPGYVFAEADGMDVYGGEGGGYVLRSIRPPNESELLFQLDQIRQALAVDPGLCAEDKLVQGARVRIKQGAFMGIEGVVTGVRSRSKVFLSVDLIGQSVQLNVDRVFVELLPAS